MVWAGGGPALPEGVDPPYLRLLKGEWPPFVKYKFFDNYRKKYILTGSFAPVVHGMTVILCVGYAMDYYFHLRHERHSAQRKRLRRG